MEVENKNSNSFYTTISLDYKKPWERNTLEAAFLMQKLQLDAQRELLEAMRAFVNKYFEEKEAVNKKDVSTGRAF